MLLNNTNFPLFSCDFNLKNIWLNHTQILYVVLSFAAGTVNLRENSYSAQTDAVEQLGFYAYGTQYLPIYSRGLDMAVRKNIHLGFAGDKCQYSGRVADKHCNKLAGLNPCQHINQVLLVNYGFFFHHEAKTQYKG